MRSGDPARHGDGLKFSLWQPKGSLAPVSESFRFLRESENQFLGHRSKNFSPIEFQIWRFSIHCLIALLTSVVGFCSMKACCMASSAALLCLRASFMAFTSFAVITGFGIESA